MYSSVTLSTFTLLYSHFHRPSPELSHLPQLKSCPHSTLTPWSSPLCPWQWPFCFLSMNLTTLDISRVFILLCLASLPWHNIFKVHPCYIIQISFLCIAKYCPMVWIYHSLFICASPEVHLGGSNFLAARIMLLWTFHVQVFVPIDVFSSLGCVYLEGELLGV